MRQRNVDKARKYGEKYATGLYQQLFQDHPEHRGPNLTKETFPAFAEQLAKVSTFANFSENTRNMKKLEAVSARAAKKQASKLISD